MRVSLDSRQSVYPHFVLVCLLHHLAKTQVMLRASCLTLEIKEFRCFEAKIEESEKADSRPTV